MQSGDSKAFVATFVATERMWLDTTALTVHKTRRLTESFGYYYQFHAGPKVILLSGGHCIMISFLHLKYLFKWF
jgi:hypothetical protein